MVKLYKITDSNGMTGHEHNLMRWGENVTHKVSGVAPFPWVKVLCTKHVIHAYISPKIASLFNYKHAAFENPVCWKAEGDIVVSDSTKVGVYSLTTKQIVPLPQYSNRNIFDLLCKILYHFTNDNEVWLDFLEDIKQKNYTDLSVLYDKYEFKLKETIFHIKTDINILNRICRVIQTLCKYYYIDDWFHEIMIDQIIRMGDYSYFSDDNALLTIIEETLP